MYRIHITQLLLDYRGEEGGEGGREGREGGRDGGRERERESKEILKYKENKYTHNVQYM